MRYLYYSSANCSRVAIVHFLSLGWFPSRTWLDRQRCCWLRYFFTLRIHWSPASLLSIPSEPPFSRCCTLRRASTLSLITRTATLQRLFRLNEPHCQRAVKPRVLATGHSRRSVSLGHSALAPPSSPSCRAGVLGSCREAHQETSLAFSSAGPVPSSQLLVAT